MGETICSVYCSAPNLGFFMKQHTMEETESKIDSDHCSDHDISVMRGNMMTAEQDLPSPMQRRQSLEGPVLPYEIFPVFLDLCQLWRYLSLLVLLL